MVSGNVWSLILREFHSWFQYTICPKTPMSHYITLMGEIYRMRNHICLYFAFSISYSILIFLFTLLFIIGNT